jgi:putative ABC transport system permease protein
MKYTLIVLFVFIGGITFAEPEILINQRLANQLSLKPGDLVEIASTGDMKSIRTFRVSHIYAEKPDPYVVPLKRNMIKMHLTDLEQIIERPDQVDLISIKLKTGSNSSALATKLNAEAIGFTAVSSQELAKKNSTTFEVVSRFHKAIAMITMMAGAIFIFALVVMRVEDQRKNFAILTVTGVSRKTILRSLVLESTFFALIASLIGAGIGIIAARIVNEYYQHFYQTTLVFARVTSSILLQAATVSFLLGMIAGTFSFFRLRRLRVLEELGR